MGAYKQLTDAFTKLNHLEHALTILHWDQEVMMPASGAEPRHQAVAELSALHHQQLTSENLKNWIDEASQDTTLTPLEKANLREIKRVWGDANILPEQFVREQSIAVSRCQQAWRKQRTENDWNGFASNFKAVVDLAREQAKIRQDALSTSTPYDALLSLFSVGDSHKLIQRVFSDLKVALPDMITQAVERQKSQSYEPLPGPFSIESQRILSEKVMQFLGFDRSRGRLDISTHPFSTGNYGDQRITTRYAEDDFVEALYATIHETGHARYEAGLPKAWYSQPVGRARNMSIHESQSLFYEKHVGGSPAFCQYLLAPLRELFTQAQSIEVTRLMQIIHRVTPGLIRVNADELTYPMHIVLRYEMESALINGEMEVEDIPAAWHDAMVRYLGIETGKNYKDGCLQDVHWPAGYFGYFPSYTLGAVNAAQLRSAMEHRIGPLDEHIQRCDLQPIEEWLSENVWQKASFDESQDIMINATGEETQAQYLIDHLRQQYLL